MIPKSQNMADSTDTSTLKKSCEVPVVRRNRPGTKAEDLYNWPDQDFNDMETVLAGKGSQKRIRSGVLI